MQTSEQINELASAMAAAQAEMTDAKRDSDNPFFKSKYADLASVRAACMGAMNKHGLSVWQFPRLVGTTEHDWTVEVETVVMHTSGQFAKDTLAVPVSKADAQGVGSAISYARRYALAAVASVAPADEDGESAVGRSAAAAPAKAKPGGFDSWLTDLEAVALEGVDPLKKAWEASRADLRSYLTGTQMAKWEAIKAKAAQNNAVPA